MPRPAFWGLADGHGADPCLTFLEPTFVARFVLYPEDDIVAKVANLDVFINLLDGSFWSLMIFTVDERAPLRCRICGRVEPRLYRGQIARASSVNAVATRTAGGASIPSS
ncbi:hypothetical protein Ato02nite_093790 [Paractinoplanes toevensis]|uniref:Uncharacterized protein n=1 Tax=Paractinoplanes toevensis TaxID=571911 RepID=A0A919WCE2_9ACTN|nr:hypothetical protein Ato02nite_093790 [Actinoplanes toevensis]